LWASVYENLSEGHSGLFGAATSRAEAQVLRLSLLYALLDSSSEIQRAHLEAALAVWRYCEQTAWRVFGNRLGDSTADEIISALGARAEGMTRNEIIDHFHRHKSSTEIKHALNRLQQEGYAQRQWRETAGRRAEVWRAAADEQPEQESEEREAQSVRRPSDGDGH
jgi:DNA replicative helicase MCM subunit Mcm2 (Cdc46/Mcm family)